MDESQRHLVKSEEEQGISRKLMAWINRYPNLPEDVYRVDFEQLPAAAEGMALSVAQSTYIVKRYIAGGHLAEYQFSIVYRIKPGTSNDARLKADEVLNALGDWAVDNWPDLGENIKIKSFETSTRAALQVPYDNGDEDHNILMRFRYEVI